MSQDLLLSLDPVDERLLSSFAAVWGCWTAFNSFGGSSDRAWRVAALIEKGILRVESDSDDIRIKYVFATEKTNEYFATLAKCMDQAKRGLMVDSKLYAL